MVSLTQYLLEATFNLLLFYLFFVYGYKKWNHAKANKWFLLLSPWLALLIPGLDFQNFFNSTFPNLFKLSQLEEFDLAFIEQLEEKTPSFNLKISDLLKLCYLLIVAFFGFRLIDKIWKFHFLFKSRTQHPKFGHSFGLLNLNYPISSLFAISFWAKKEASFKAKQRLHDNREDFHWTKAIGVFSMEILTIGLWFHPLIYLFKKELILQEQIILKSSARNIDLKLSLPGLIMSNLVGIVMSCTMMLLFSFNYSEKVAVFDRINPTSQKLERYSELIIFNYKKPKPPSFLFEWGNIQTKLEKIASSNVYSAEIEVELKDFLSSIDSSILVFKNDKQLFFKELDVNLSRESELPLWFPNISPDSFDFKHRYMGDMKLKIKEGDGIYLSGEVGKIFLANLKISIKDPFKIYFPELNVPPIKKDFKTYGFQIVNLPEKKALIRIDTNSLNTAHILDLYSDNEKYEIVHIQNFKTNKRLISSEKLIAPEVSIQDFSHSNLPNWFRLPEYQDLNNKLVKLFWGKMKASPSSQNYTKEQLIENYKDEFELKVGKEKFRILKYRLTSISSDGASKSFILEDNRNDKCRTTLEWLVPLSSIYIDKIMVKKREQYFQFPISFVFNIGKKQDQFEISILESQLGTPKESLREPGYIYFQNYSLTELIKILGNKERLIFDKQIEEPFLDVYFRSESISTSKGEKILLKKIREQFHYRTETRHETRKVYLLKEPQNTDLLEPFEYFYKIRPKLDVVIEQNWEKGLETISPGFMDELSNLIEDRFDIIVFNETNLKKAYAIGLDFASIEGLKNQLKNEYGLELVEEERVVKIIRAIMD